MEILRFDDTSAFALAYHKILGITPYTRVWFVVYTHLWDRFDDPFLGKDK